MSHEKDLWVVIGAWRGLAEQYRAGERNAEAIARAYQANQSLEDWRAVSPPPFLRRDG
jgi:hypothetical protein